MQIAVDFFSANCCRFFSANCCRFFSVQIAVDSWQRGDLAKCLCAPFLVHQGLNVAKGLVELRYSNREILTVGSETHVEYATCNGSLPPHVSQADSNP